MKTYQNKCQIKINNYKKQNKILIKGKKNFLNQNYNFFQ